MNHLILCFLFILISSKIFSQQSPFIFNATFQVDTNSQGFEAVRPIQNGYLAVGNLNSYNDYSAFYIRIVNLNGGSDNYYVFQGGNYHSAIYSGLAIQKTHDDNFILVGEKGISPYDTDLIIIKFTVSGDVIFDKLYQLEGWNSWGKILTISVDSYLLVSVSQPVYGGSEPAHIHLIKTDSVGEPIWEQYLAENAIPIHAEQTLDGGFLISGYQYNDATGYDMYVVKTNANGEVEWERTYGTPQNDGGSRALQRSDGLIILTGVIRGEFTVSELYYAHLNPANGDVLYSITHQKYDKYSPGSTPLLLSDDRLALATLSYGPPPTWEVAFTIFDNAGNIIQETPISSGLPGEDYIRDLEPTPDGGFILAGFNYTVPQSSWVVKLGPNGEYCGTAPCVDSLFTSAITTPTLFQRAQTPPATLYPNPAKGSTTITYTLPPQLPFAVLELYNLQGQKVQYWVLPAGGSSPLNQLPLNPLKGTCTQTVDLSGIAAGVYVWRVVVPGGYEQYEASGKLVVE